ncbi:MAG: TonB-dependent receptor, partial [Bacteroidota bacterium]
HFQTEVQGSNANTTAFEANPSQHRQGLVGTYRWHPISSPLQIQLGARQDWQDGQRSPFLPELKIQWNQRTMRAFAHISRSFRWPTLNDRFWEPGGNPNLLPEQGWSQEVGSKWYFQHKTWSYQMGFNAFARQSDNWIIWVPEGLFFSPQNVRTVNHWGISPSFSTSYSINSWRIQLKSNYHWLSAVNSQSNIPNDQSEGKQLIYVPTHQADAQLQLDYAAWQLSYVHQWMGQIYTLGDHSQSIPAFQLAFLGLSKKWRFGQQQLHTYLQIRNIWNTDYEFVIQRPMPGRHCRVGVAYTLSSLKNN